jgi:hypothetical protein
MYISGMAQNKIDANIRCPSCSGQLFPRVLVCDSCGLKVEGDFVTNEFGVLTPDEMHFLRVFIYCEGRIRDMEAALGVSYPTVKASLTAIKKKLNLGSEPAPGARRQAAGRKDAEAVLDRLESGELSYDEALAKLRGNEKGGGDERVGG